MGHVSYSHRSPSWVTPSYSPADSFSLSATTILLPMPARRIANASRSAVYVFPLPLTPSRLIFSGRRCRRAFLTSNPISHPPKETETQPEHNITPVGRAGVEPATGGGGEGGRAPSAERTCPRSLPTLNLHRGA